MQNKSTCWSVYEAIHRGCVVVAILRPSLATWRWQWWWWNMVRECQLPLTFHYEPSSCVPSVWNSHKPDLPFIDSPGLYKSQQQDHCRLYHDSTFQSHLTFLIRFYRLQRFTNIVLCWCFVVLMFCEPAYFISDYLFNPTLWLHFQVQLLSWYVVCRLSVTWVCCDKEAKAS